MNDEINEELNLIKEYRNNKNDIEIQKRFIEKYKRYIWSCVKKYSINKELTEDLFQAGCEGLIVALNHYDIESGYTLLTFAGSYINRYIKRTLDATIYPVYTPGSIKAKLAEYKIAKRELQHFCKREATREELAVYLALPIETIIMYEELILEPAHLDKKIGFDEESETLLDSIADKKENTPEARLEEKARKEIVQEQLQKLNEIERLILLYRYNLTEKEEIKTYEEIGKIIGKSKNYVRKLEQQALKKLAILFLQEGLVEKNNKLTNTLIEKNPKEKSLRK